LLCDHRLATREIWKDDTGGKWRWCDILNLDGEHIWNFRIIGLNPKWMISFSHGKPTMIKCFTWSSICLATKKKKKEQKIRIGGGKEREKEKKNKNYLLWR
jgi:hypothetical protein